MLIAFGVADILQKEVYPVLPLKVKYYLKRILNSANLFSSFFYCNIIAATKAFISLSK